MITLLVVVVGNTIFGLLLPIPLIPVALLDSPGLYESVFIHAIIPNIGYATFLIHPFAYALYFKQIREPMMRLLKGITCPCKCKSAAVAPQPQRRINWLIKPELNSLINKCNCNSIYVVFMHVLLYHNMLSLKVYN